MSQSVPSNVVVPNGVHQVTTPLMLDPNSIPALRPSQSWYPSIGEMREIISSPIWDVAIPATDTATINVQQGILFDDDFNAAVIVTDCEIELLGKIQN